MKKLNEMLQKRASIIAQMEALNAKETMNEEETRSWDALNADVENLDKEIERAQKQEKLNKSVAERKPVEEVEEREEKTLSVQFRDWLKEAIDGKAEMSFRADPVLTTTDTGIINKTVADSVDILVSPGEAFLAELGVTFYPDLNGNFVVPNMAQDTAAFVSEDASAASANMAPSSLTLAARRVTHTQSITKETLAQTNPAIYQSILQNLINGIWNAVTNDVFDTLDTDAATQITDFGVATSGTTFDTLVQMEASIGGLNIGPAAYVTTPTVKAKLKKTIALGTTAGPAIWGLDNTVNGYRAYGVPAANANKIYFGDFSRQVVGQWGGIEVIVDPYTAKQRGVIELTAVGLFDTGCANKRAFCILKDVSIA